MTRNFPRWRNGWPVALSADETAALPRCGGRTRGRVRRRVRDLHPGPRPVRRRLRRSRAGGLQRDPLPQPARRDPRHARRLLRGRCRCRRDGELRQLLDRAQRVRHRRPGLRGQRRRRPPCPRGRRRVQRRRSHTLCRRLDRSRHEVAESRAHRLRGPARLVRGAGRRAPRRRCGPVRHRNVHGPPPGQGGDDRLPAGDEVGGPVRAAAGPGDDGDHRADARRQRDRRRPRVARGDATRRSRHQLRHWPGGDARAPALPVPALDAADQRAAQRRPAQRGRRAHALRPLTRGPRRVSPPPRHRTRRVDRRRLLWHHS